MNELSKLKQYWHIIFTQSKWYQNVDLINGLEGVSKMKIGLKSLILKIFIKMRK